MFYVHLKEIQCKKHTLMQKQPQEKHVEKHSISSSDVKTPHMKWNLV